MTAARQGFPHSPYLGPTSVMCKCKPRTALILRVSYASLGIVTGVVTCLVFGAHFGNRSAAIWGLCSSLFAALTLCEFLYLYVRREVKKDAPTEWALGIFGCAASLAVGAGLGGIAAYLGLGILDSLSGNEPSLPQSHYVVCVWCFMTFKWGITAYFYALRSSKYIATVVGYTRVPTYDPISDPSA